MTADLRHGDCLEVMRELGAGSVTAIVTDPPYGLEFMGREWDHGVPGEPFWTEALRVAKPGSMLMAFGGTRTYHRLACAIEDAGWEIRDCLMWLYGQGFPKSLDVSKAIDKAKGCERERVPGGVGTDRGYCGGFVPGEAISGEAISGEAARWSGYGTALKPAWEPIILAMKPPDGTFAGNAERHGVAGLNIDGTRVASGGDHAAKCASVVGLQSNRNARTDSYSPAGRWPANLALDETAAGMVDEQSGEQVDGVAVKRNVPVGRVSDRWVFALGNTGRDMTYGGGGGASRFFYTAKASTAERGEGNRHPTVKPLSLMRWLVRLVTMPSGTRILDPFMGSGTTGCACAWEGVDFIGIERESEYLEIARRRIAAAEAASVGAESAVINGRRVEQPSLFGGAA